jgi:hypothetical protein
MGEERMIGALVVAVMAAMALVLSAGALIVGARGAAAPSGAIGDAAAASDTPTVVGVTCPSSRSRRPTWSLPRAAR